MNKKRGDLTQGSLFKHLVQLAVPHNLRLYPPRCIQYRRYDFRW